MSAFPIKTVAELAAEGRTPEVLFWVGCAGSFDQRAQKITQAFARILHAAGIEFAILGEEEFCTGDPAKRAGNEFIFQMAALTNIETLNGYGIRTIVTTCPHCFNIIKNEYPELGGTYEVYHHSQFLQKLLDTGRLRIEGGEYQGQHITYHDSCYLGRGNGIYEVPRQVIRYLDAELVEMRRNRRHALCCGAGGAQIFKEAEKGTHEVNEERTQDILATGCRIVATACPFCMLMFRDGIKARHAEDHIEVKDISELLWERLQDPSHK